MASEVIIGEVLAKRIYELTEKLIGEIDANTDQLIIDNENESDSKRIPLATLLSFLGSNFSDADFTLFNSIDSSKQLQFVLSSITTATTRTLTIPDISGLIAVAGMINAFSFGGQAHSGNHIQTFSASTTFDANNGNNQEMVVTASTTIGIINELPGTYIFTLEIDSISSPTITIGASFGSEVDNSATIINADNDINIITLVVRPDLTKYYTINTITA